MSTVCVDRNVGAKRGARGEELRAKCEESMRDLALSSLLAQTRRLRSDNFGLGMDLELFVDVARVKGDRRDARAEPDYGIRGKTNCRFPTVPTAPNCC